MDPIAKPIKTTLPSGLQVITVRTERKGLMAGIIQIEAGAAHAEKLNPKWLGLPHFDEHMILNGSSRGHKADEVKNILEDDFYTQRNAATALTEALYFETIDQTGTQVGQVYPARNFWSAFEIECDGVFFPEFDDQTMAIQRKRILNEIDERVTERQRANRRCLKLMYGLDYLELQTLGAAEQVRNYNRDDCHAFHRIAYSQRNTRVIVTGDVIHNEAVEKINAILKDVPPGTIELPSFEESSVQRGEFRYPDDDANAGLVNTFLNFPTVSLADSRHFATYLAVTGLSRIINEKIEAKFGFYTSYLGYKGWHANLPYIELNLRTGEKEVASDALAYALEIMQAPETVALIAERHNRLVGSVVNQFEISQHTIQYLASATVNKNTIGALFSPDEEIERFRKTTPDQVATIIDELNTAPAFLEVRGHAGALDAIPSIDVVDGWRSLPKPPKNGGSTPSTSSPPPPRPA